MTGKLRSWIKLENIVWKSLIHNPSPDTFELLSENLDKIHTADWRNLCVNPDAVHF